MGLANAFTQTLEGEGDGNLDLFNDTLTLVGGEVGGIDTNQSESEGTLLINLVDLFI